VDPVPDPLILGKSGSARIAPGPLDLWPGTLTTRPQRRSIRVCIASVFSINYFALRKINVSTGFGRERTAELTMTEITMVGECVSCYARLSISEKRRQWVDKAVLCV
jgi:hypothetical protein